MIHTSMLTHVVAAVLPLAPHTSELFARGGGGGSGGGGGGGVGGLMMLGYVPAHFVTDWCYKHISAVVGMVAGIATTIAVTGVLGLISGSLGFIVFIGAVIGVYTGTHNTFTKLKNKMQQSKSVLQYAAQRDGMWQEETIQERVRWTFMKFQQDWSRFDLASMRTYMSPRYYQHMELMMTVLYQMGRQNLMNDVQVGQISVVSAVDERDNDKDQFTAYIKASATDVLVRASDNWPIYTDTSSFEEFWRFDRQVTSVASGVPDGLQTGQDVWVLDGVLQATEDTYAALPPLQRFADEQGMFYSLDMGRLLIPDKGQLFSKARFGSSDINNHVIGKWGDLIVQLYTYIPLKGRDRADDYLVGQMTLPKSYGGIIVKRKVSWKTDPFGAFSLTPSGYQKVSMEWPDFNDRYTVYATDMEKVTSFELLNPAYMAKLYDANLPISIEVVDNIVYFYALVSRVDTLYGDMLGILQGAYKELKM